MKRTLYLTIIVLFLSFSFSSKPPGWYVQTLPVNKNITDIFFRDSLNGWAVTEWAPQFDTGYILNTTNGGDNWNIQFRGHLSFTVLSFPTDSIGYAGGGDGFPKLCKTTNGGINWILTNPPPVHVAKDAYFVNNDTGWTCDDDPIFGGLYKTTNGSLSWIQQLDVSYQIQKIFFLNKDTGWAGSNDVNGKLYQTTDGGVNWNLQFTFISHVDAIYFLNNTNGWSRAATNLNNIGVAYTTNGGSNWANALGNTIGGFDVKFINDSIGYAGTFDFPKIMKSTNGGKDWGYQSTPIGSGSQVSTIKEDTSNAWSGSIMHTADGGGQVIITSIKSDVERIESFVLFQNHPNPFNPVTNLEFEISSTRPSTLSGSGGKLGFVILKVYDIAGKEVSTLVNQRLSSGRYSVKFNGTNFPSGVYFYNLSSGNFTETKKMILTK